ncbi:hypothetical protein NPIL_478331 [Nephila pilipes]|uniref:Uncharacterized protein n=1 Tax=Nephila pilipes TaxID=299642 RepID=A0A8X6TUC4_NEPPI|nr:hypothetical protein NPIL_478331 [Nephila pilipes]
MSVQHSAFTVKCEKASIGYFKISYMLAENKRTFQDDEILKETFLANTNCLTKVFSNNHEVMLAILDFKLSYNPFLSIQERNREEDIYSMFIVYTKSKRYASSQAVGNVNW